MAGLTVKGKLSVLTGDHGEIQAQLRQLESYDKTSDIIQNFEIKTS